MSRPPLASLTSLMLLLAACSSTTGPMTEAGGTSDGAGGSSASAGTAHLPIAGAASAGGPGAAGESGVAGSGNGGTASGGTIGGSGAGSAGAPGSGAAGVGGLAAGHGGAPAGGAGTSGGSSGAPTGGVSGSASAGAGGASCPGEGHITYVLAKSASPTATEQAAYARITTAMDKAISYYDCYTNITKSLKVSYVPSVETADGNINGSMRFGMNTTYMDFRTAMHEIGHTVGIGQAANWGTFLSGGLFTGPHAAAQLKAINAKLSTPLYTDVHADTQHFWPYGINQQSEVKSEADLIAHCQMVVAIRQDLGL
jgi:hypothetical protein